MFRSAIVRSLRASVPRTVRAAAPRIQITPAVRPAQFVPVFNAQTPRFYSAPASLSKEEVEGRIVNLLKNFDKVCTACRFGYNSNTNIFGANRFPMPARFVFPFARKIIQRKMLGRYSDGLTWNIRLTELPTSQTTWAWTASMLLRS